MGLVRGFPPISVAAATAKWMGHGNLCRVEMGLLRFEVSHVPKAGHGAPDFLGGLRQDCLGLRYPTHFANGAKWMGHGNLWRVEMGLLNFEVSHVPKAGHGAPDF